MPSRRILAWALYDWANSAFATVVIAGFFPVFFAQFWAQGLADGKSTQWLGYTSSAASLILVLTAPVLGALADQLGAKKRFPGGAARLLRRQYLQRRPDHGCGRAGGV